MEFLIILETLKGEIMWIKNTEGRPDAMLTFATISFIAITLNIVLTTLGQVSFGGTVIVFSALDSTAMGVYLAATFSAYVGRRFTDRLYTAPGNPPFNAYRQEARNTSGTAPQHPMPRNNSSIPSDSSSALRDEFEQWKSEQGG